MNSFQSSLIRFLLRRSNIWNKPLNEVRKTMENIKAKSIPEDIEISREEINNVYFEVFRHSNRKKKSVVLYFHGGGFCLGIYNANREFVAKLAVMTEMDVFMPDYRLAPENPFPAALEDATSAYRSILSLSYEEKDIIIMGDSSGCALAVSALLILKQGGEKMPHLMAFITPVFDLVGNGDSFISKASKDPFKLTDPLRIAKNYIGANNPTSPMLSPLNGELEGLPKTLIHAAENDVFLSDSIRYAEKASNAQIKVFKKMWHIFHMQSPFVPESRKALTELCLFIESNVKSDVC